MRSPLGFWSSLLIVLLLALATAAQSCSHRDPHSAGVTRGNETISQVICKADLWLRHERSSDETRFENDPG